MTRTGAGFSLVELVIVVTIVSILTLTVTLGVTTEGRLTGARADTPARAADTLATAVAQARDTALMARRPAGLRPHPDGWEIMHRADSDWHAAPRRRFSGSARWRIDGAAHDMRLAGSDDAPPAIRFLADGRSTPFSVVLGAETRCATDGWEPLRCGGD